MITYYSDVSGIMSDSDVIYLSVYFYTEKEGN